LIYDLLVDGLFGRKHVLVSNGTSR
jgi:hypothetical protein